MTTLFTEKRQLALSLLCMLRVEVDRSLKAFGDNLFHTQTYYCSIVSKPYCTSPAQTPLTFLSINAVAYIVISFYLFIYFLSEKLVSERISILNISIMSAVLLVIAVLYNIIISHCIRLAAVQPCVVLILGLCRIPRQTANESIHSARHSNNNNNNNKQGVSMRSRTPEVLQVRVQCFSSTLFQHNRFALRTNGGC